jgi:hypothetical protein
MRKGKFYDDGKVCFGARSVEDFAAHVFETVNPMQPSKRWVRIVIPHFCYCSLRNSKEMVIRTRSQD